MLLSARSAGESTISVTARVQLPSDLRRSGDADVMLAVAEDGLTTRVQRGENRGSLKLVAFVQETRSRRVLAVAFVHP